MSPENSANSHLVLRADVAETNKTEGEQVTFFLCSEGLKKINKNMSPTVARTYLYTCCSCF